MPTLNWLGKEKVVNHHADVPYHVLDSKYTFKSNNYVELEANSINNRIIQGDNLIALKSLLPEFEGEIDCIYIDPPYNTGNEAWVYNDNVNDPRIIKWLGEVVGKEGDDLSRHDKWLCMMYPRLKLLHKLLSDDGIIFISIDGNEFNNLRLILDEIFGLHNFITTICCINNPKGRSDDKYFATAHEYILVYKKKNDIELVGFEPEEKITKRYNKIEGTRKYREIDLRKTGDSDREIDRPDMYYPFFYSKALNKLSLENFAGEDVIQIFPMKSITEKGRWRWGKDGDSMKNGFHNLEAVYMPAKKQWTVIEKDFLDSRAKVKPTTVWDFKDVNSERGTELLYDLLGFKKEDFPNPKPLGTVKRCIGLYPKKNAVILDSFSGSGTTAHAVLELNREDDGKRKFILCEMMDYAEDITAERVRRVMNGYGNDKNKVASLEGSFDFYGLGASIFTEDGMLNEKVGLENIRSYISHSEKIPNEYRLEIDNQISPSAIGHNHQTLWLLHYQENTVTSLDLDFLSQIKLKHLVKRPTQFVIYADKCPLDEKFMLDKGIVFKRIPRDIFKF